MEKRKGAYTVLVGAPEVRRPLGGPRCRRQNNIKIDIRKLEWAEHGVD